MRSWKTTAMLVLFVAACAGAAYASGYLVHWAMGYREAPLAWNTGYRYLKAITRPDFAPYAWRIQAAFYAGTALPFVLWVAVMFAMLRRRAERSLHGNARFATAWDLLKKGMFRATETSLIVGKMLGRPVYMSGQQFALLAAPTRSGKGVGVVIPNLLSYRGSVVVLDIKQENFALTSGWRKAQGQEVHLFNPFAEDMRSSRWNPLHYVADDVFRISDLMALAETLYPDGNGDDKFWVSQSRNAFVAFALYLFEKRDAERQSGRGSAGEPTLGKIFTLSTGKGDDLKTTIRELAAAPFISEATRNAFSNLISHADKTFSSVMGMFREPLNMFINPVLVAATSGNDFLLTDVRKKRMSIYIGIQPNKLGECRTIVNLFFSQLVKLNTKELPSQNPALKHQCLLLMDEFTAMGKVDVMASAVAYIAGYNLRLLPIIQSVSQLDATYGAEVARSFVTNHALQIVFTPREQRDANEYSEMIGYTSVQKESVSRGRDVSRSSSEERRALMLPQELKAMSDRKQVFFYEGIPHPVLCGRIRYFEERRFKKRVLDAVTVPVLNLGKLTTGIPVSKKKEVA